MKKDIFIDNNIAKNFANPLDPEYKKLIKWLLTQNDAYLVVSVKLLQEYKSTCANATSPTSIPLIIDRLTRDGRLLKIERQFPPYTILDLTGAVL
ncbi:MAG: hypothetical protein SW833_21400 [Cyanobacteriota bacterium]|nr:hypothetical protein [Cyanobacteriota bacterium]